jgi:hypothetical protein
VQNYKGKIIAILFLAETLLLSVYFFKNDINKFPQTIHAWAQSDRLALALNFIDNGFDFFHPQTYCLNGLLDEKKILAKYNGITAVDFPLHDFNVAMLMNLFNTKEVWVFKTYILAIGLLSLAALWYLFKLFSGNKTSFVVLLIPAFLLTIPVINFYLPGFLPCIPSFSFTLFGIYFLLKFCNNLHRTRLLNFSILFFTLSTLPRTTHLIFLFAALLLLILLIYRQQLKLHLKIALPFILSFGIIAFWFYYNNQLRNQYGSLFMNWLTPSSDFPDFINTEKKVFANWSTHYFTVAHYIFLFVLTVFFFAKRKQLNAVHKLGCVYLLIAFIGLCLFKVALSQQFILHDYYFIDTFYIITLVFIAVGLSLLKPKNPRESIFIMGVAILFCATALSLCNQKIKERKLGNENDIYIARTFKSAKRLLQQLDINKEKKLLVIYAGSPNIPLIHLQRKAFVVLFDSPEYLNRALSFPFDYILMANKYNEEFVKPANPDLESRLEIVGSNNFVSVYKLKPLNQ